MSHTSRLLSGESKMLPVDGPAESTRTTGPLKKTMLNRNSLVKERFSYEFEKITRKHTQNGKRIGKKQFDSLAKGGKRTRLLIGFTDKGKRTLLLIGLVNTPNKANGLQAKK